MSVPAPDLVNDPPEPCIVPEKDRLPVLAAVKLFAPSVTVPAPLKFGVVAEDVTPLISRVPSTVTEELLERSVLPVMASVPAEMVVSPV